jgi:2'-5' RNA ligase
MSIKTRLAGFGTSTSGNARAAVASPPRLSSGCLTRQATPSESYASERRPETRPRSTCFFQPSDAGDVVDETDGAEMTLSSRESALVVLVPESEAVVKPFRDRYDPSAAAGVPAHITLLYPFKASDEVDDITLRKLRDCFVCLEPIRFSLGQIQRFPLEVLYLAPEPDEPFRQLTMSIWNQFPETPPYGGKWPTIIPHLSVAQIADEAQLTTIADDFAQASQGKLPIRAIASKVTLMDNRSGRWSVRATFSLGHEQ